MSEPETSREPAPTHPPTLQDALPPEPSHPPPTLAFPETRPGDRAEPLVQVPGFDVLSELGRGGMGIVYKALDLKLKRFVALKLSRTTDVADSSERARFRAEAEAVARLRHPHIVQIYEVGEFQSRLFFTFEYVDGGSLADALKGVPQPARYAAELVETVARAMHVAHQHGIIHRDLKPANVLLASATPDGKKPQSSVAATVPKIADFGVAKLLDKHSLHTATGAVLGTPNYMAPEQAWGAEKTRPVGPAADVYALGAILYEMLTGRPPFLGETAFDTLQQVVTQDPVAPTRLQPKIPRDLETICLKCLQKEPPRRYESAEALADDLRRFLDHRPILAQPSGPLTRLLRWRRRNPEIAALLATTLVLLVAGITVSTYFAIDAGSKAEELRLLKEDADRQAAQARLLAVQAQENARAARANSARAEENLAKALASEQQAKDNLRMVMNLKEKSRQGAQLRYWAQMAQAQRALLEKDVARISTLLEGQLPANTDDLELRGFEWHYLRRRCGGNLPLLPRQAGPLFAVAFSTDGTLLAVSTLMAGPQGRLPEPVIMLWRPATGKQLDILKGHGKRVLCLAFHPDRNWLAGGADDGQIKVWDLRTASRDLFTCKGHEAEVTGVQFSGTGRLLVSSSADKTVRGWDAATGKGLWQQMLPDAGDTVALAPKTDTIAVGCRNGAVLLLDGDGKARALPAAEKGQYRARAVLHCAFHPKGTTLATALPDGAIQIWDVVGGSVVTTLKGHNAAVVQLAFSGDGRFLASVSEDKTVRLWDGTFHEPLKIFTDHLAGVRCLAFSPDSSLLVTGSQDGTALVRRVALMPDPPAWKAGGSGVRDLAWSGDGKTLACCLQDLPATESVVTIWDAGAAKAQLQLAGHTRPVLRVAFQPKGPLVATAGMDGTVRLWNAQTGAAVKVLGDRSNAVYALAWSPDGRLLAAASDVVDLRRSKIPNQVTIWDVAAGTKVRSFTDPFHWPESLAWSGDGKLLAMASTAGSDVQLWHLESGAVTTLKGHAAPVNALAFSGDGRHLASASADQTVRVWDLEHLSALVLKGHAQPVLSVCFHKDGNRLASGGDDGRVKLWDLTMGQEILSLDGHTKGVAVLAFRPDGHQLATGSRDGTVRLWDATPLGEGN
jgi:WD40 repeat protein/serine/threonine protein kinase